MLESDPDFGFEQAKQQLQGMKTFTLSHNSDKMLNYKLFLCLINDKHFYVFYAYKTFGIISIYFIKNTLKTIILLQYYY